MMELICLPGRIESADRDLSAADWLRIGTRAGQGRKQVGLAAVPGCPEEYLLAVTAGVLSAGADSWEYGRMTLPEFLCCVRASSPSLALMLQPPREARVASAQGEALFPLKKYPVRRKKSGGRVPMESLRALYPLHLLQRAGTDMEGMAARFVGGGQLRGILQEAFCRLGGSLGGETTVRLWQEGGRVTLSHSGEILWDGEAPGGDGPAQALQLLAGLRRGMPRFEKEFCPAGAVLLPQQAAPASSP